MLIYLAIVTYDLIDTSHPV